LVRICETSLELLSGQKKLYFLITLNPVTQNTTSCKVSTKATFILNMVGIAKIVLKLLSAKKKGTGHKKPVD
jgi:hypothetical protein